MIVTIHVIVTMQGCRRCQMLIDVKRYIYKENGNEVSKEAIGVFRYFWDLILFRIEEYCCITVLRWNLIFVSYLNKSR